jgi:tetratricopeptide (TPR) repeat protein
MTRIGIILFAALLVSTGTSCSAGIPAQHGTASVNWKAELEKARAGIEKNPKSAFWHNQAGIAYDALGDFESAIKELKTASALDASNPAHVYALYALFKRKGLHDQQREILLDALERDPINPVGRFEFANLLEKEKHWADSLREYREAKRLAANVKGSEYIDPRGNPYDVSGVRVEVNKAIDRVAKLSASQK